MTETNINARKRVAIVGATGYSGAELTAILARHHEVELVALFSSSSTARGPVTPTLPQFIAEPFTMEALVAAQPEIVFLCTPNEVSANLAPQLLDLGMKVIDLSGAFRLRRAVDVSDVVRLRSRAAEAPRRGGLRPDRVLQRRVEEGAARRQSRLLSDLDPARAAAADVSPSTASSR